MISTSDGSPTKEKKFLDGYVERAIQQLQEARIPSAFQRLAQGEVADDIVTKAQNKQIIV